MRIVAGSGDGRRALERSGHRVPQVQIGSGFEISIGQPVLVRIVLLSEIGQASAVLANKLSAAGRVHEQGIVQPSNGNGEKGPGLLAVHSLLGPQVRSVPHEGDGTQLRCAVCFGAVIWLESQAGPLVCDIFGRIGVAAARGVGDDHHILT
jgi:hypothetical protein